MSLQDPKVTPPVTTEARTSIQGLENTLRWAEILWISKRRPVKGTIVALHKADSVDPSRLPCFMLPSLPQLSTDYVEMAKMMDPGQPFFAVYLPSDKRNPEMTSTVHKLARYYADEIALYQPQGALAIGGWSAGGIVARMVAQLLQQAGRDVPLLIVIDGAVPTVDVGPRDLTDKIKVTYHRIRNLAKSLGEFERDLVHRIRHRPPINRGLGWAFQSVWQNSSLRIIWERTMDTIATRLSARKPVPGGSQEPPPKHPAEIASNISSMPPDHRACAIALYDAIFAYTPEDRYDNAVVVYESTAEPDRSSERVAERWAKLSTNLVVVQVEGSHMSIVKPPHGQLLARDLSQRLLDFGAPAIESKSTQTKTASNVG
jgi:thioesterase domain-containing protein